MTDFYIVKTGTPILGMDLVTALQLHFKGGQVIPETETVKVCATLCQPDTHRKQENESPIAFGCAKDFVHKVKIRPEVKPVQQKLRRLPLSVREAVSQELRNLEQHGIIERIDASEWVSPIVVTKKKSGDIRMGTLEVIPKNIPDGLQGNATFYHWSIPFRTAPWPKNENKA
ncbi:hypothetical protein SKAU_G00330840 [Synaphobranchus kaupii]|uniref:Uncharacterized protein n=1 Tax=Synaphobranchus kaupii TaxID=118154 RepID=A0A9Q1EL44_SYNKA|nr:hypothetical protein SKAU_G00330840 [Synaphobranchus kaupii]